MKLLLAAVVGAILVASSYATPPAGDPEHCKDIVKKYTDVDKKMKDCTNITLGSFVVPGGKTLNLNPAKSFTTITCTGNISFEHHQWLGPLVQVTGKHLTLRGTSDSVFDGNGQLYWDGLGEWGPPRPDFFFFTVFDSVLEFLNLVRTPKYFTQLNDSINVTMRHFYLFNLMADKDWSEPYHSGGNSDGFNVWNSSNVLIENSEIFNQDDCIAVRCGNNIHVRNLFCHGGQGFSMSVGWSNDTESLNTLTNVLVEDSTIMKGHNAVHIKTHLNAGNGLVENITYRNIFFEVGNHGIQIQQNFANLPKGSHQPKEARDNIPIRHLRMINVKGRVTNTTQGIPVYILCAKTERACVDWVFSDVNVTGIGGDPHWHDKCNFNVTGFNCTSAPNPSSATNQIASFGVFLVALLVKALNF